MYINIHFIYWFCDRLRGSVFIQDLTYCYMWFLILLFLSLMVSSSGRRGFSFASGLKMTLYCNEVYSIQ